MANFEPKKIVLENINNGQRYVKGDEPEEETFNAPIEASAYAQEVAESAKKLADELKEDVVQKQGTVVYVNGVAQNRVEVKKDIQEQIDELSGKINPKTIYWYASEDSKINLGYPNGIKGGSVLSYDFSAYKELIIWINYNNLQYDRLIVDFSMYVDSPIRLSTVRMAESTSGSRYGNVVFCSPTEIELNQIGFYNSSNSWNNRNSNTNGNQYAIIKIEGKLK